jgi:hypothetical protein
MAPWLTGAIVGFILTAVALNGGAFVLDALDPGPRTVQSGGASTLAFFLSFLACPAGAAAGALVAMRRAKRTAL